MRTRKTSYRSTAVPVLADYYDPGGSAQPDGPGKTPFDGPSPAGAAPVEDPYQLPADPGVAVVPADPTAPCVHGAPFGTSCIYCRHAAAFDKLPPPMDPAGEQALRHLLRRLISDARHTWNASARTRWKQQWDKYLAWYLSRRLVDAGGITVDLPE